MNARSPRLVSLLDRDLRNTPWRRVAFFSAFISAFQAFTVFASGLPRTHRINWDAAFFFLWMFAFVVGIAIGFDRISSERESRALDLILTSGVPRRTFLASKAIVVLLLATVVGIVYVTVTSAAYAPWAGVREALGIWPHLVAISALFAAYGCLGLACSAVVRTSKRALLAASSLAIAGRPRLWEAFVEKASSLLELGPGPTRAVKAICPEMALTYLTGVGPGDRGRGTETAAGALCLCGVIVLGILVAFFVFTRQDERTYGD